MAAAAQISPQMLQMLAAGGAPGAPGGAQAPPQQAGAAPPAAAIGRMLQGQRMMPQAGNEMAIKLLESCMVQIGKVLQTIMMSDPKAYQTLLKCQSSLHSAVQQLREGAQENQEHAQMTNSVLQLLRSSPGGSTATGGGVPMGGGAQLS